MDERLFENDKIIIIKNNSKIYYLFLANIKFRMKYDIKKQLIKIFDISMLLLRWICVLYVK